MLLLIAVALVARLSWSVGMSQREPRFDEVKYLAHASDLSEGRGFVDPQGERSAYWPVGYPVAVAVAYEIVGKSRSTAVLLQIAFGLATCVFVSRLGTAVFSSTIGRLAALSLAVYPTHIFYSTLFLTEPLFALLLTATVALLLKSLKSWPAAVFAGITLGLATLVRPVVVLLPICLIAWYWLQERSRRSLLLASVVGLTTLVTLSPWLIRNHGVTGRWTVVSTTGGHNFWIGNHPEAFGGYAYDHDINSQLDNGKAKDYSRGYVLGLEAILSHPAETVLRSFRKVTYFFALETDGVLWNLKGLAQTPPAWVTLLLLGFANAAYVSVLALAVLGLLSRDHDSPLGSLFLLVSAYLVVITVLFIGDPRYHYALVPLATLLGAKGLTQDLPKLVTERNRRRLLTGSAIVVGLLILMASNVVIKMAEIEALSG